MGCININSFVVESDLMFNRQEEIASLNLHST